MKPSASEFFPSQTRVDSMEPKEAVQAVREACHYMAENIIEGGICLDLDQAPPGTEMAYNDALADAVKYFFPGINGDINGISTEKKIGHVIHWIIFRAGLDINHEEWPQNGNGKRYPVVRADGFDPGKISSGIMRYRDHIETLAAQI